MQSSAFWIDFKDEFDAIFSPNPNILVGYEQVLPCVCLQIVEWLFIGAFHCLRVSQLLLRLLGIILEHSQSEKVDYVLLAKLSSFYTPLKTGL